MQYAKPKTGGTQYASSNMAVRSTQGEGVTLIKWQFRMMEKADTDCE